MLVASLPSAQVAPEGCVVMVTAAASPVAIAVLKLKLPFVLTHRQDIGSVVREGQAGVA